MKKIYNKFYFVEPLKSCVFSKVCVFCDRFLSFGWTLAKEKTCNGLNWYQNYKAFRSNVHEISDLLPTDLKFMRNQNFSLQI